MRSSRGKLYKGNWPFFDNVVYAWIWEYSKAKQKAPDVDEIKEKAMEINEAIREKGVDGRIISEISDHWLKYFSKRFNIGNIHEHTMPTASDEEQSDDSKEEVHIS